MVVMIILIRDHQLEMYNMLRRCVHCVPYLFIATLVTSLVVYFITTPTRSPGDGELEVNVPWVMSQPDNLIHGRANGELKTLQDGFFTGSHTRRKRVAPTKYHPHTLGQNVVQHSRLTTLATACADHTHNSTHSNYWRGLSDYERQAVAQRIIVDDHRSLLFCHTPLSGVSAWMKVMYFTGSGSNLDDIGHVTNKDINNRKNFVYLTSYSLEEQEKRLQTYFSFMVVQHPLLRAATTYRLKFLASNRFFQEKFGAEIREKYRTKDKQIGNVRFTEFVHYLVGFENQSRMNEHWKPLEQLCRPCEVNYDVILHHESMLQDSEEVLTAAHLTERVPELPRDYWDQVTVSYAHQLFGEVPSLLLGRLVTQYSNDFNMFSYSTLLPWKH